MKILAFSGLRYTSAAGTLDDLAAPPFDQIDDDLRDRLHDRSPFQFSHLTRPIAGAEGDPHRHARMLHDRWREDGVIASDPGPALYPYRIEMGDGTTRLGLACLVDVGPAAREAIRPHELTVAKPLADRLALLEELRVDLEPVMFMCDDQGALEELLAADFAAGQAVAAAAGASENERHSLFRISDRRRIDLYRDTLARVSAVIADGHHRTRVAQLFVDKHSPPSGTAASAKLAVLMSLASDDLVIDPIHRAVQVSVKREALEALVQERTVFEGEDGRALAAAVAAAPPPALGVRFRGRPAELWRLDRQRVPAGIPGGDTALPAVLLHHQLLPASGLDLETATDGSIAYRSDPQTLWRMVEGGDCAVGFWLPPMPPADFAAATRGGDVLPPKSTRFLPKLVSGLVWAGHDADVG